MLYIVRCPCSNYEQEYTTYYEAFADLKQKNVHGCCKDCYPHRHKLMIVENKNVESEESERSEEKITPEIPKKLYITLDTEEST
jgi:hypothetical protein